MVCPYSHQFLTSSVDPAGRDHVLEIHENCFGTFFRRLLVFLRYSREHILALYLLRSHLRYTHPLYSIIVHDKVVE